MTVELRCWDTNKVFLCEVWVQFPHHQSYILDRFLYMSSTVFTAALIPEVKHVKPTLVVNMINDYWCRTTKFYVKVQKETLLTDPKRWLYQICNNHRSFLYKVCCIQISRALLNEKVIKNWTKELCGTDGGEGESVWQGIEHGRNSCLWKSKSEQQFSCYLFNLLNISRTHNKNRHW